MPAMIIKQNLLQNFKKIENWSQQKSHGCVSLRVQKCPLFLNNGHEL
jgi:hypothetical protein